MSTINYTSISDSPDELINTSLNSSTNDEYNLIGVISKTPEKTSSKLSELSKDYVKKSSDNDDKSRHKSKSHHKSSSKSSSSHSKKKSSADSKHRSDKSDNVDDDSSSSKKHKSKRHRSSEKTSSGKKIMLIDPLEIPSKKRRENDKSSSSSKNISLSQNIVEMTKQMIDNNNGQSTQIGISKKPRISRLSSDKSSSSSSSVTTQNKNDEQKQTKDNSSVSTVTSTSSSENTASLNNVVFTPETSKKIDDKNKNKKESSTGDYLQKKKLRYQRELEEIERKRAENAYVIPKPKPPVKKQKIVKKIDPKTLKELTSMYESVSVPDELTEELNRQMNSSGVLQNQKDNDNQSSSVSDNIDEISRGLFIRDPRRKSMSYVNKLTDPSGYVSQSTIVTPENTTESIDSLGETGVSVNGPPLESFHQQNYSRMSNNFSSIPYENIQTRQNQYQHVGNYNNQPMQSQQYPSTMYNQTGGNYSQYHQHHQQYAPPMSNQTMEYYQTRGNYNQPVQPYQQYPSTMNNQSMEHYQTCGNYNQPVQPHQQYPSAMINQSMEHYQTRGNYNQPVQHQQQQHASTINNQSMENYQTSDNYHQPVQANQQLMNAIVNTIKVSETNPVLSNIINQIEKIPETINNSSSNQNLQSPKIIEPNNIIRVRNFANLPDSTDTNDTNVINDSNDFYNLNDLTDEMEKVTISDIPKLCDNLNTKIPDELNIHDDVMSYDDCISNFANIMQPLLFDAQYGEKSISEIIEKKEKLIKKYMKLALSKNCNNLDILLKDICLYFKKNKLIHQLNENDVLEIAQYVLDVSAFF